MKAELGMIVYYLPRFEVKAVVRRGFKWKSELLKARTLPHDIKRYISHKTFRISYRISELDTIYQNDLIGPQPKQQYLKFAATVADVICHALVLTIEIISVYSDGNKIIDKVL